MLQADFSDVARRVRDAVEESPIGDRILGISIDENTDETGGEFLRVMLSLRDLKGLDLEQIEVFVRSIEDSVAEIDERFASVRLAEAA